MGILLIIIGCTRIGPYQSKNTDLSENYLSVVSHTPLSNEIVFANSSVTVTFSHDIDMNTVNATTFYVVDERNLIVSGTYVYIPAAKTVRFTANDGFAWGEKYTVYITTGVYNTSGLHMKDGYSWSFSIAPYYDLQNPSIDTSSVQPSGSNVNKNASITFRIIDNGHIDVASIPSGVRILDVNGENIPYNYWYNAENKEIICTPLQPLIEGLTYTVYVTSDLHDEAGNPLDNPYSWQFTVQAVPPQVLSVYPVNGQTNVSVGEYIVVTFSEPVQESTLAQGLLIEDSTGSSIAGTLQYNPENYTATFIPDNLNFDTDYTVTISTEIKDTSGIPLAQNFTSTFRTMQENIQPEIISVTPVSPIDVETVFQIDFSEPMNDASLYTSIILRDSYGHIIPVTIDYDELTYCCTVTPYSNLAGFYEYVLEVTTDATDIHGNPLIQNYSYAYVTNPFPTNTVVLVYMPADYTGGEYIIHDINELIQGSVNINPAMLRIVGFADYQYDNNTQLFESIYGCRRDIPLSAAGFNSNECDMANKDTIQTVLNFIHSNYHPQQILFVLLDRTVRPLWCIAHDATSNSYLTLHDFAEAIKNYTIPVVAMDAPVKSTVEVAYELRSEKTGTHYMVASQGDVLAGGFNYTALANALYSTLNQQPPPANMAYAIAQSICSTSAYPLPGGEVDKRSLALIDLQQIKAAADTMNTVVPVCQSIYITNPSTIDTARFAAHFYYPIPWYVDLVEFLQATGNATLINTANSFSGCVLKKVMPAGNTHSGLSIMFTTKTHEQWYETSNPYSLDFLDYNWDEFLQNEHFGLYKDADEPENDREEGLIAFTVTISSGSIQLTKYNYIHDPYDIDIYTVNVNPKAGAVYELTQFHTKVINNENKKWNKIACNDDGSVIAATAQNGYIYVSTNGGSTWNECTGAGSGDWRGITVSESGAFIAASVNGGYIYTSDNYGASWVERTVAGTRNWRGITCSADGEKLAAVVYGGNIYTSSDGGNSWQAREQIRNWIGIAGSEDGQKLLAAVYNGYLYNSANGGESWGMLSQPGQGSWMEVASSSDGQVLVAVALNGNIMISADYGVSWVARNIPGSPVCQAVSITDDGSSIAVVCGKKIYVSNDYGQSWLLLYENAYQSWSSIWYAGNGHKILATVNSSNTGITNGTLTIDITGIPENCEVALGIINQSGEYVVDPDTLHSGIGGQIHYQLGINTDRFEQYHLYLVPVNIMGWSMNTKEQYTLQLQYNKN
ncbi:MAG: Ig-like domain-containing protein [Spirochaetota bacterium]